MLNLSLLDDIFKARAMFVSRYLRSLQLNLNLNVTYKGSVEFQNGN